MQPSEQPASQPSGTPKPAGPLSKTYNAWSGYTFLKSQGIEKSSVRPIRGVISAIFLGLTGLQVADAFVSTEPLKSVAGAAGSLVIGSVAMWGASAIEVGCKKLKNIGGSKPQP